MHGQQKSFHWIAFFTQPLLTLIHYLINFRKPAAKNIIWAFTVYFASTIAIGAESQKSDIVRYMGDLRLMADINSWNSLLIYYQNSGEIDVFRVFFSYLISLYTDNGYILIIFFGIIFGYFYSRNIWFVLDRIQGRLKLVSFVLISCLFLIVPIWDLGGFRFWTATHVFLFGLLPFLYTGKKKSLLWCFLTPFIFHYAFIVPLLVLCTYLFIGDRLRIYFYFFILSIMIGEINISQVNSLLESYAPQVIVERSSSYRGEEKTEAYRAGKPLENKVWYVRHLNKFLHWPLYLFLILLYWKSKTSIKKNVSIMRLLCFTLLFYGFANLFSTIPSGSRFLAIAGIMTVSFLVLFMQNHAQEKIMTRAIKLALPFLIIFIIVQIRMSWYFFSVMTLIGNPLIAMFNIGENISINDIIKGL